MRLSVLLLLALPLLAISPRLPLPDAPLKTPTGLNVVDWSAIRAEYERHRHKAFPIPGGFEARNFHQQWLAKFDGRAFRVTPDVGAWTWGLELRGYGFAASQRVLTGRAQMATDMARVTYRWGGGLEEWYLNDTRGLEHGFTLHARPAGASGPLHFDLAVLGGLTPRTSRGALTFVDATGAAQVKYAGLKAWDATGRALAAHFEPSPTGVRIVVDERGAQYPITVDPLAQQAYVKASNTAVNNYFGSSVAVSGDTVVVGAFLESGGATGVNGSQSQGGAIQSGAAYVFVRNGSTWLQQAYLKASNAEAYDSFGFSVAISGDLIIVGAEGEDSNATGVNGDQSNNSATVRGAAYVFARNAGVWTQQAYLKPSTVTSQFGFSVAVSGDTAVVGTYREDNLAFGSGAAFVFFRTGSTWTQQAYLKASNAGSGDNFGWSVAASGDTIVVGAQGESSSSSGVNGVQSDNNLDGSGAAYVFTRSGTTWTQQAYLKASNPDVHDNFGRSISISGDTIVVGAPFEDSAAAGIDGNQLSNTADASGAAYVFARAGTAWSQQAYLKAHNPEAGDGFGSAVAVSGDTVLVGAPFESSNSAGVNGPSSNNGTPGSGAAYVYSRIGLTWSFSGYLKASASDVLDNFGAAAALSGATIVLGAYQEASAATGIDGNQLDNSLTRAGAAYIFADTAINTVAQPSGAWPFDQGSGTVAADSSGNNSTGTLAGSAGWTPAGRSGAAIATNVNTLTNATGSVNLGNPSVLSNLTRFTWSFWAYPTGEMVRGSGPAIEKGNGSDVRKSFSFGANGSSNPFAVSASVAGTTFGALSVSAAGSYALNTWSHWTMTYDDLGDRIIHIYKNGVEVPYFQLGAIGGLLRSDADTQLAFGATPGSGFYGFNGILDEVRIYNRVLTAAEIQTLAGSGGPAKATTTVLAINAPVTSGQPVELVATVTAASGTPAGTVTFRDGATSLGTATVTPSGVAVLQTTALAPGGHTLTAEFTGGIGWANSTSSVATYTAPQPTALQLLATPSPAVAGQPIILTATVTSSAGIPTGTVTFEMDARDTVALDASGRARLTTTTSIGLRNIIATFTPSSALFLPSSGSFSLGVQGPVTATLTGAPNPSTSGQAINFTVAISSTYGPPYGVVTLFVDGAPAGNAATTFFNSSVAFSLSNLTPGSHSVLARFVPDQSAYWLNATSNTITQLVQSASTATTATTLSTSPNPAVFGQTVTFAATVTSASGTPRGTVTFRDGPADFGTIAVNAAGYAAIPTAALSVANHPITAVFKGEAGWANSTSSVVNQVVVPVNSGTANPIGLWAFDEGTGNNAADTSGSSYTAILTNATWTPGRFGSAVNVNNGGVVNVGNPAHLNDLARFTWAFWARPTGEMLRGLGPAIVKGSGSDTRKAFNFGPNGSSLPFSVNATVGISGYSEAVADTYSLDTWAHWTLTYDDLGDRKIRIYKNGVEVAYRTQTPAVSTRTDADTPLAFGATPGSGFFAFNGALDDIRIYNRVLTPAEIQALSATGSPTTTALTSSSVEFLVADVPYEFTATVSSPGGIPAGVVRFLNGPNVVASVPVDGTGRATLRNATFAAGTLNLTAEFTGGTAWLTSGSNTLSYRVLAHAVAALTASRNPSIAGEPVTFTVTVTSRNGIGVPVGPVQLFADGGPLSPPIPVDAAGKATFTTSALPVGLHPIQVVFSGDLLNWSNSVTTINHQVWAATATTLAAPPNPIAGQPIVFTANVTSPSGTPIGNVAFSHGALNLGSATLANGQAIFTGVLPAGLQTVTATFTGDPGWTGSTGSVTLTVQPAAASTTTIVTSSGNPVPAGQPVIIFATVTSTAGTPRGSVQFLENGVLLATGTLNANGNTSFTTSSLTPGTHLIHASFTGDPGWLSSNSVNPLTQVITPIAATTSTLTAAPVSPIAGDPFTLTVNVTSPAGTPRGDVTFFSDATVIGGGTLDTAGRASITIRLAAGSPTLRVVFTGAGGWADSSATLPIVIQSNGVVITTTTVTATPNPATVGQPILFTATVTSAAGTPSGLVNFVSGSTILGSVTLNAQRQATFTTASLPVGTQTINAVFTASTAGWAGTSGSVVVTVQPVATGNNNPVGLWTFNEGAGNTAADTSGNGNTATLVNAAWAGGPSGTPAVRVTGGVVTVGNPAVLNNLTRFTWAFFANATTDVTRGIGPVIEKGSGSDSRKSFNFGSTSSSLPFSVNASVAAGGRAFSEAVAGTYSLNTWNHWALTYDDAGDRKLHIFKNGVEVAYRTQTAATGTLRPDADTPFAFGATPNSGFFAFNGELDDVRIYNRVLAPNEIRALVGPVAPKIAVGVPQSPVVSGQPATFTATVTSDAGTPSGTVEFSVLGTGILGRTSVNANGQATFTTLALPVGTHPVAVWFLGNGDWANSQNSDSTVQIIASAPTTTSLASSRNPAPVGQLVTFTAQVSSPVGIPSGTVTFRDGSTILSAVDLTPQGQASFSTSVLAGGSHTITASYFSNNGWDASTSTLTQVIQNQASNPTTLALASSLSPSSAGQGITLTATVSSPAGVPAGRISFRSGGTLLVMATPANGVATYTTSALAGGSHSLTATFTGDPGWADSTSNTVTQVVLAPQQPTSFTLATTANPAQAGQMVTFTATVTSAGGIPAGTVTLRDGAIVLVNAPLDATGKATYTTSALSVGSHIITGTFAGTANWANSTSNTVTQVIQPATGPTPAGLWTFNEGAGPTAADTSGNNNTATLSSATWTAGRLGSAVNVTGGIVNVGNPAALNNLTRFTWAFWANSTADVTRGIGPAIEKGSGSDSRKSFNFSSTTSSVPFSVNAALAAAGGRAFSEAVAGTYALNTWAHWALTYDDQGDRKLHIYKNGVEVAYRTQTAATGVLRTDADTPFAFGATPNSGFFAFNGALDDVRIYNRVLTPVELQALSTP